MICQFKLIDSQIKCENCGYTNPKLTNINTKRNCVFTTTTESLKSDLPKILANPTLVDEKVKEDRMKICKVCEFFNPTNQRCKVCTCYTSIKTAFEALKCPINKW